MVKRHIQLKSSFRGAKTASQKVHLALYRIDPATGDREVLSGADATAGCNNPGDPWSCCTGIGTSDGTTPPCVDVGSGLGAEEGAFFNIVGVPAAPPQSVASLPTWGLAANGLVRV